MIDFKSPAEVLKEYGFNVDSVTDVIITHAHHDHIEAIHYFKNATIHIQYDEYQIGKTYIPENFHVNCFEDVYTIDNCVKILKIGGHSIGSCIVVFEKGNQKYVITGDECYIKECLDKKIPTGSSCCHSKSRAFVEQYGSGDYVPLLCRDIR